MSTRMGWSIIRADGMLWDTVTCGTICGRSGWTAYWLQSSSETPFERPPHFDALAYLVQTMATLPRKFAFEVLLKTELVKAQREIMEMLGVLEQREEGVLLRGGADDLDWVARELAKLSFDFVIHEPEGLRAALRKRAAELTNLAEQG